MFVYREMSWRDLVGTAVDSARMSARVVFIMVSTLQVGMVMPRNGLNLFVGSSLPGMRIMRVGRAAPSRVAVLLLALVTVRYVPGITLALP